MSADLTLIHTPAYANWVFNSTHPTQGRRFTLGRDMIVALARERAMSVEEVAPVGTASVESLATAHSDEHITNVLERGLSGEWDGARFDLAELAATIVQGTMDGLDLLISSRARTVVHLPGAKHHALRDRSSGFCVFNDFAIAAQRATVEGHRVAILDFDAHHGDGTEALTYSNPSILTYSIHDVTAFPWQEGENVPEVNVYNAPLAGGSGGPELAAAVDDFIGKARDFGATLLFVVAGADGHSADPLASLDYTDADYEHVAKQLRAGLGSISTLIGGAGGYRPDDVTPRVWAQFAISMADETGPVRLENRQALGLQPE